MLIPLKALSIAVFSGSLFFYFDENNFAENKNRLNLSHSKLFK
jgi:hypothetical protein